MTRPPRDVAASVRARLLRRARERGDDFQLVLTRYLNERLLYRLSQSPHGPSFVLEGATVFTVWTGEPYRATRDVDLLGFGDPSQERLRAVFRDVLAADVPDDGVWFRPESLAVGPIRSDQEYGGSRVTVESGVAAARVRLQVDVGFGDAVTPNAVEEELPTLLDFPRPRLRVYPRETVVAEKLEAMVTLVSSASSRRRATSARASSRAPGTCDGPAFSRGAGERLAPGDVASARRATSESRNLGVARSLRDSCANQDRSSSLTRPLRLREADASASRLGPKSPLDDYADHGIIGARHRF
jgi:hypothetical protein